MNWTSEQLSAILAANNQVGIDTAVTAPGNTPESPQPDDVGPGRTRVDIDGKSPVQLLFESTVTGFCQSHGLPAPEFEYKFHPRRRWRADAAIPSIMVLIELEGGTWGRKGAKRCPHCGQVPQGRHNTGAGYEKDKEKYNAAELLGWHVLSFTTAMLQDGRMLATLSELPPF